MASRRNRARFQFQQSQNRARSSARQAEARASTPRFTSPQNSFMQPGQGYTPTPQPQGPAQAPTGPGEAWQPDPGGRPLDWQEEAYRLQANRGMALGNADATYQRGQLEQEYGYGNSGAANPYSRAALLEESFKRSKLGTTNSMASAGQLNSGAYGRAQNENQRQYSIASDQNRRGFDQQVYGLNYGQAERAAQYGIGVDDAAFQALLRALGGG